MTGFAYLATLVLAIGCIALLDARWKLAVWRRPTAAVLAVLAGALLLLVWDLAGIALGVFARGDSLFATGVELAPELPVEEPIFLLFLSYLTLVIVTGIERMLRARTERGRG